MANPLRDVENLSAEELANLQALARQKTVAVVASETRLDRATIYRAVSGEPVHRRTAEVLRNHLALVPRVSL